MPKVQKKRSKILYGINEIVKEIQENTRENFSKDGVKTIVNAFLDIIENKLTKSQDISLIGYFSFYTRKQPAKKMVMRFGKKRGQEVKIPAKTVPAFKFSAAFRKRIVESK
jgi:nucleoid DNA-binding protein